MLARRLLLAILVCAGCEDAVFFRLTAREGSACEPVAPSVKTLYILFVSPTRAIWYADWFSPPTAPRSLSDLGSMIGGSLSFTISTGTGWQVWVTGFENADFNLDDPKLLCGQRDFSLPVGDEVTIPIACFPDPAAQCALPRPGSP